MGVQLDVGGRQRVGRLEDVCRQPPGYSLEIAAVEGDWRGMVSSLRHDGGAAGDMCGGRVGDRASGRYRAGMNVLGWWHVRLGADEWDVGGAETLPRYDERHRVERPLRRSLAMRSTNDRHATADSTRPEHQSQPDVIPPSPTPAATSALTLPWLASIATKLERRYRDLHVLPSTCQKPPRDPRQAFVV